jgi:plasmid stabilization system protein ParE
MKNGYKIEWSAEALTHLDLIVDYLENRWTEKEINKFFKALEKRINLISKNPLSFPVVEQKLDLRRSVLSEQTTIYYQIQSESILIITLFDNRKDPDSNIFLKP